LLMTNISKFEELQKRANLSTNNLDTILQDLEKKRLMMPVEKSGPFGKSIQLKITEKGAAEFRRM
jgi:predicted transcriptional regulator